ncbi:MAG: DUF493 domain-containing protein [Burkholderiales bacterium]|nr:DUF493 domain-containing protein [Burkholderiales bacterium]
MSSESAPGADSTAISDTFDRIEQLLDFPADFPLKVMGARVDGFAQAIAELACHHVPGFDPATIELRTSSKGTYLSLTLPLRVGSRAQLEALYRAVASHPGVKVVL